MPSVLVYTNIDSLCIYGQECGGISRLDWAAYIGFGKLIPKIFMIDTDGGIYNVVCP
jgi:hypothetical protein